MENETGRSQKKYVVFSFYFYSTLQFRVSIRYKYQFHLFDNMSLSLLYFWLFSQIRAFVQLTRETVSKKLFARCTDCSLVIFFPRIFCCISLISTIFNAMGLSVCIAHSVPIRLCMRVSFFSLWYFVSDKLNVVLLVWATSVNRLEYRVLVHISFQHTVQRPYECSTNDTHFFVSLAFWLPAVALLISVGSC